MRTRVGISVSSFAEADRAPLARLERAGVDVVPNPHGRRLTEAEAAAFVDGLDGLVAGLEPLTRTVLARGAPRLRAVARVGIGVDNVDLVAAAALGVRVSNTPDGPTEAVAEMTLAALLAIVRGIVPADAALHAGRWEKRLGRSVRSLTVLVVGYGRIGKRVTTLLRSLGANVLVHDPLSPPDPKGDVTAARDLSEALGNADVVTLHASGRACILGADAVAAMKPGAVLLNAARAELCDEAAVVAALRAGTLAAAWFDVFWSEPYDGPLRNEPNALLTPHVATYTSTCRREMELAAVENVLRDLEVD